MTKIVSVVTIAGLTLWTLIVAAQMAINLHQSTLEKEVAAAPAQCKPAPKCSKSSPSLLLCASVCPRRDVTATQPAGDQAAAKHVHVRPEKKAEASLPSSVKRSVPYQARKPRLETQIGLDMVRW